MEGVYGTSYDDLRVYSNGKKGGPVFIGGDPNDYPNINRGIKLGHGDFWHAGWSYPEMNLAEVIIYNRKLKTLRVDTETTFALRALVPPGTVVVSESGQRTRADLDRLAAAGVDAVLIGEAVMRAEDVEGKVRELLGTTVNPYLAAEMKKRVKPVGVPEGGGNGKGG